MKKRTKQWLIAMSAVSVGAVAAAALYRASADRLITIAMDRQEPKHMQKSKQRLMGSAEYSEIVTALTEAAQRLESREHETVEITGHDGVALVGHWFAVLHPKRVVIAMHGWRSSWANDFGAIADFWLDNDCSVLFAEQRGQGESGGEYMGFGLLERYDCLEWIKWAIDRTNESLPVYLGGVSMGATTVLMTAGFELPAAVRGIVADCAFTSPHAIWKHVVENNLHIPYGIYSLAANDMCRKRIQLSSDDYSCTEALNHAAVPILFIHGTDDHFVPIDMTYENYKACVAPKQLFVVPGADHGMSYLVDKTGYESAVRSFWEMYD